MAATVLSSSPTAFLCQLQLALEASTFPEHQRSGRRPDDLAFPHERRVSSGSHDRLVAELTEPR